MYRIEIKNVEEKTILHENNPDSISRLKSGGFTEGVNLIPSFDFTILPFNPCYNSLSERLTEIEVFNEITNETEFEGVLIRSKEQMTHSGAVYKSCGCEGFLGYLCDSIQPYHHYESNTVTEFLSAILDVHNSLMPESKRIDLGSCDFEGDNTNSKTTAYRTTFEEIKENLINRIGGEIRVRRADGRLVLDFMKKIGNECSTTIELAKNIRSLEVDTDTTSIITRLIPLGSQINDETAERIGIESVNDGKSYLDDENAIEKYGIIVGTAVFDDITLPENLIKAGREYQLNNNRVKKAYRSEVLDLSCIDSKQQNIRSGNSYHFIHSILGIDENLRLMKRSVDIFKPYCPTVEIGDKSERITDIATRTVKLIEYDMPKQKLDILASAKATASALIRAGINGKVVVNPNEILILDAETKEEAVNVWRFNINGWGHSSTGYNGEYTMAATLDGGFVADFITAGVLRGLEITNGNGTFHVSPDGQVKASAIEITGGRILMTTESEHFDVIQLNHGNYGLQVSPYSVIVRDKDRGFRTDVQGGGFYCFPDFNGQDNRPEPKSYINGNGEIKGEVVLYRNDSGGLTSVKEAVNSIVGNLSGFIDSTNENFRNFNDGLGSISEFINETIVPALNDFDRRIKELEG